MFKLVVFAAYPIQQPLWLKEDKCYEDDAIENDPELSKPTKCL